MRRNWFYTFLRRTKKVNNSLFTRCSVSIVKCLVRIETIKRAIRAHATHGLEIPREQRRFPPSALYNCVHTVSGPRGKCFIVIVLRCFKPEIFPFRNAHKFLFSLLLGPMRVFRKKNDQKHFEFRAKMFAIDLKLRKKKKNNTSLTLGLAGWRRNVSRDNWTLYVTIRSSASNANFNSKNTWNEYRNQQDVRDVTKAKMYSVCSPANDKTGNRSNTYFCVLFSNQFFNAHKRHTTIQGGRRRCSKRYALCEIRYSRYRETRAFF